MDLRPHYGRLAPAAHDGLALPLQHLVRRALIVELLLDLAARVRSARQGVVGKLRSCVRSEAVSRGSHSDSVF